LPQAEAHEQLLSQICKLYDSPEARDLFVEFISSSWDKDPLTGGGCPAASLPPGVLDSRPLQSGRAIWKVLQEVDNELQTRSSRIYWSQLQNCKLSMFLGGGEASCYPTRTGGYARAIDCFAEESQRHRASQ
ncbi:hypothetical protein KCU77_g29, partial [Aureobasidium melanogenum]